MKAVFKAGLLCLLLLVPALSALANAESLPAPLLSDPKYSYFSLQSFNNFTLRYNPEKIGSLVEVRDLTQRADDTVNAFFKGSETEFYRTSGYRTTVALASDNSEFRVLINVGNAPDEVKALNWNEGLNGLVAIKSPAMLPDYRQVLAYQMARIAERTRMGQRQSLAEWYQDGLASYVASYITQEQRDAVNISSATNMWTTLDGMESAYENMTIYNWEEPNNKLVRAHSALLVEYIGSLYGNVSLLGIVDDYTAQGDLNRSFVNRTGFTPDELDREFRSALIAAAVASAATPTPVPSGNGTAEGFLLYQDGTPAARTTLSFVGQGMTINATTDADGRYHAGLPSGRYEVIAPGDGAAAGGPVTVTAGSKAWQNITIPGPPAEEGPVSSPSLNNLITYGLIVAGNIVGALIVIIILRRNWH